jgi:hypothetical protein
MEPLQASRNTRLRSETATRQRTQLHAPTELPQQKNQHYRSDKRCDQIADYADGSKSQQPEQKPSENGTDDADDSGS